MSSFGTIQLTTFHNLHIDNVTIHVFVYGVQLNVEKKNCVNGILFFMLFN
jgi:hypothetical protein